MIGSVWDDPIMVAGLACCPVCARVTYPSEASWLDDTLIIASFPASCGHSRARTAVIDPKQLPAMPGDPCRYVSDRRCAGRTRAGRPCRGYAETGSDFCSVHGDAGAEGTPA